MIRTIAFYLPQFHPTQFNDEHWGKGFTEWSNVARATPQFEGHLQPRLPADLGFYDLRVPEVRKQQADLAKEYDVHGFCYYYYRFNGRRELDFVLSKAVEEKHIPFCICWANENWTRSWDGLHNNVILSQNHNEDDDLEFIKEVSPILMNEKYIRVNDKPLLLIYRTELWNNIKMTTDTWRNYFKTKYGKELYLVRCDGFQKGIDPCSIGFDAAYQFPPLNFSNGNEARKKVKVFDGFVGGIPSYENWKSFVENETGYKLFRGVMPSWDNTPRKMQKSHAFYGSSPFAYKDWLRKAVKYTQENFTGDEQLLFINAWNEWAEGAVLEPCKTYGNEYLKVTKEVLNESR